MNFWEFCNYVTGFDFCVNKYQNKNNMCQFKMILNIMLCYKLCQKLNKSSLFYDFFLEMNPVTKSSGRKISKN